MLEFSSDKEHSTLYISEKEEEKYFIPILAKIKKDDLVVVDVRILAKDANRESHRFVFNTIINDIQDNKLSADINDGNSERSTKTILLKSLNSQ